MLTLTLLFGCIGGLAGPTPPDSLPQGPCRDGDAAACATLAARAKEDVRLATSRAYAEWGCELGSGEACTIGAEVAWQLDDRNAANALARRSCEYGHAPGCHGLGLQLAMTGPHDEMERAYVRGCESGYAPACGSLGFEKYAGELITKDIPSAMALWEKGCSGKDGQSCHYLGTFYMDGLEGIGVDRPRAEVYFAAGCASSDMQSCAAMAREHEPGGRLGENAGLEREYRTKACALGLQRYCN